MVRYTWTEPRCVPSVPIPTRWIRVGLLARSRSSCGIVAPEGSTIWIEVALPE